MSQFYSPQSSRNRRTYRLSRSRPCSPPFDLMAAYDAKNSRTLRSTTAPLVPENNDWRDSKSVVSGFAGGNNDRRWWRWKKQPVATLSVARLDEPCPQLSNARMIPERQFSQHSAAASHLLQVDPFAWLFRSDTQQATGSGTHPS
jgi:hypothetical protein